MKNEKPSKYSSPSNPPKIVFRTIENDYEAKDIFSYLGIMAIFFIILLPAILVCAFSGWASVKLRELKFKME